MNYISSPKADQHSSVMASMKDLFPHHDRRKKSQRNFVRENIKNARTGNVQCSKPDNKQETKKLTTSKPVVKCRVTVSECDNKSDQGTVSECEKSSFTKSSESLSPSVISCRNCGYPISEDNISEIQTNTRDKFTSDTDNSCSDKQCNDFHQLSHANEQNSNHLSKSCLDLSSYQKGEVPKYLKERNAKLKQQQLEQEERNKMYESLGLNDPNCPPGHMLMSSIQLEESLKKLESRYDSLIQELNKMPFSNDSLRIKNRKIEIEKDLNYLDKEIEQHKSGKVFVKIS